MHDPHETTSIKLVSCKAYARGRKGKKGVKFREQPSGRAKKSPHLHAHIWTNCLYAGIMPKESRTLEEEDDVAEAGNKKPPS